MEIPVVIVLTVVAFVGGWWVVEAMRKLVSTIERPLNLTCRILGHNMQGPYPIGKPGEVRFLCPRCYRLMIVNEAGYATTHRSAKYMDDPLVNLIRKAKSFERHQ